MSNFERFFFFMESFALHFNSSLFYIELSFWILNYMDIEERKSENKIFPTIGRLGVQ